jgi:hypothetical protein
MKKHKKVMQYLSERVQTDKVNKQYLNLKSDLKNIEDRIMIDLIDDYETEMRTLVNSTIYNIEVSYPKQKKKLLRTLQQLKVMDSKKFLNAIMKPPYYDMILLHRNKMVQFYPFTQYVTKRVPTYHDLYVKSRYGDYLDFLESNNKRKLRKYQDYGEDINDTVYDMAESMQKTYNINLDAIMIKNNLYDPKLV